MISFMQQDQEQEVATTIAAVYPTAKIASLLERLVLRVEKLEQETECRYEIVHFNTFRSDGSRHMESTSPAWSQTDFQWNMLALSTARPSGSGLPPKHYSPSGNYKPSQWGAKHWRVSQVQLIILLQQFLSPVTAAGGCIVNGTINGVQTSFLLDMGAAVTLL